jgi:hypothetical protein
METIIVVLAAVITLLALRQGEAAINRDRRA